MSPKCSLQPTNVIESQVDSGDHAFALRSRRFHRRTVQTAALMLLVVAACFPQNSVAQQAVAAGAPGGKAVSQAKASILIPALLASTWDSKKLKTGDEVSLKMTAPLTLTDGSTLPHGTMVVGHVAEAKTRSKGDTQSLLAIKFDKVSFPDGKTWVVSGLIKAVGPDLSAATDSGGGVEYSGNMARTTYMPSVSAQAHPVPMLNEQSVGVVGLKNLQLDSDGVLSSSSNSVKLDKNSQVLLQVEVPGGVQAASKP